MPRLLELRAGGASLRAAGAVLEAEGFRSRRGGKLHPAQLAAIEKRARD